MPPRQPHREALKFAPLERILLETEAPKARQEKTWEPADLMADATALSRLKGVGLQRIKEVTTLNGDSLGFITRSIKEIALARFEGTARRAPDMVESCQVGARHPGFFVVQQ